MRNSSSGQSLAVSGGGADEQALASSASAITASVCLVAGIVSFIIWGILVALIGRSCLRCQLSIRLIEASAF